MQKRARRGRGLSVACSWEFKSKAPHPGCYASGRPGGGFGNQRRREWSLGRLGQGVLEGEEKVFGPRGVFGHGGGIQAILQDGGPRSRDAPGLIQPLEAHRPLWELAVGDRFGQEDFDTGMAGIALHQFEDTHDFSLGAFQQLEKLSIAKEQHAGDRVQGILTARSLDQTEQIVRPEFLRRGAAVDELINHTVCGAMFGPDGFPKRQSPRGKRAGRERIKG